MIYNATFYNISVILWRSVLLMEEIGALTMPRITQSNILFTMYDFSIGFWNCSDSVIIRHRHHLDTK
jgi:hypothetical protein